MNSFMKENQFLRKVGEYAITKIAEAMSSTLIVNFNYLVIYYESTMDETLRFTLTILLFDIVMTIVYLYVAYDAKEWDGPISRR